MAGSAPRLPLLLLPVGAGLVEHSAAHCCLGAPPLQDWLSTKGSPRSVIERAEFGHERQLEALEFSEFAVRRQ